MDSFKIALIQMSVSDDPSDNLTKAMARIAEAASMGASVVCLPELFRSQYFCKCEDTKYFNLAETIPGPTTRELCRLAKETGVAIVAPIFEKRAPGLYHNTAVLIDREGELSGIYRKMHIPDDPGYYEKFYFTPGDLGFVTFNSHVGQIGILICWDQWFPEAARIMALGGANILFFPTAIGWHTYENELVRQQQMEAWKLIQRAHAVANGLYIAAANRTGMEKTDDGTMKIQFWGSSFVADPFGDIVAQASVLEDEIVYSEIFPARIEDTRRNWPFLRDRRVDAYEGILQRYLGDDVWRNDK
jgi:N-carbamoylputrescine amidase